MIIFKLSNDALALAAITWNAKFTVLKDGLEMMTHMFTTTSQAFTT